MTALHDGVLTLPELGQMLGVSIDLTARNWGNADATSFAAEPGIPFKMYTWKGTTADVGGRPQAMQIIDKYFSPTTADSAEAFSAGAFLVASPVRYPSGFTQGLPLVGVEGDAVAQSNHILTNKAIGVAGAAEAQDTAQVTNGIAFYAAGKSAKDAGAVMTNAYGLYVEAFTGSGTVTNKWGVYSKEDVQTEKRVVVGVTGASAIAAKLIVQGASTDSDSSVRINQGAGQSTAFIKCNTSGAQTIFQLNTTGIGFGVGHTFGSGVGLISLLTTTIPSGTPPAASAYIYVDPADNKLKAKTSGGTVTILTPTA